MSMREVLQIEPMSSAVGAEISGVDLAEPLRQDVHAAIREALGEYGVVFFRDQTLTPEQHLAFAERWGEINVNRFFSAVEGYPRVAEVRKEPDQKSNIGNGWHTDHSYDEAPAMGSVLYALEVPPIGGDTLFANMYAAYESLSEGMQRMLESMHAVHSSRHVFGANAKRYAKPDNDLETRLGNAEAATQDSVHPVVIRHPISGRKALYVNPAFTVRFDGWSTEESAPLLQYLYRQAVVPERVGRFRWTAGAVAFWDNRAVWHYAANDYQGHRRYMHRITIEGERLH